MKLRTELMLPKADFNIDHTSHIVTLGSCFADIIGSKLSNNKFKTLNKPFGTIFNPLAISDLINKCIQKNNNFNFIKSQELWQAFECHSSLGNPDINVLKQTIAHEIDLCHDGLKNCNVLIITLGTAIVYREKHTQLSVANCHKLPASAFEKETLSPTQITESLSDCIKNLQSFNPNIKIILTLSPVRHIKDGISQNALSKAILRVCCDTLTKNFDFVSYFPSYEFIMDDLRDYRFYKEDLIHPNVTAENYIWEKFIACYLNDDTILLLSKLDKIQKAIQHRPFFPETNQYQKHLSDTLNKLNELNHVIDLQEEINQINKLIHK